MNSQLEYIFCLFWIGCTNRFLVILTMCSGKESPSIKTKDKLIFLKQKRNSLNITLLNSCFLLFQEFRYINVEAHCCAYNRRIHFHLVSSILFLIKVRAFYVVTKLRTIQNLSHVLPMHFYYKAEYTVRGKYMKNVWKMVSVP